MRIRLQTVFLLMTCLAVVFVVLGPRIARWLAIESPVVEDSETIFLKPRCEGVASLSFSADGKYLASTHTFLYEAEGSAPSMVGFPTTFVMLWDVRERGNFARFQIPGHGCQGVRFTPDGKRLVLASTEGLMFWNVKDQALHRTKIANVSGLSPDGSLILTFSESGVKSVLNSADLKVVTTLSKCEGAGVWAISRDGSLAAFGYVWPGPKRIEIWNITNGKIQATLPSSIGSRMCASFSPDGKLFSCASIDGKDASVFDAETGKLRGKFGLRKGPVWCLAFSPSGKTLAVGGEVGEVHWWDASTGDRHGAIEDGSVWGITAVAFSPDGTQLAVGDGEGNIKLIPIAE